MFRFLTAGESHGLCLTVIVDGLPAGLKISQDFLNQELGRRQQGYGRGGRMAIERDQAQVTSGMRRGQTLGSPVAIVIANRDWANWEKIMDPMQAHSLADSRALTRPRPGHADLVGALKYQREDLRDILERASARETAARVAAGSLAKALLAAFDVRLGSWVESIGPARWKSDPDKRADPAAWSKQAEQSDVRCPDSAASLRMRRAIKAAGEAGDTLGGIFTVAAWGMPAGLGSHVQWDQRLDMRVAGAVMSIPAIKGVEFGLGFQSAMLPGSKVHDPILYNSRKGFSRQSNRAGGTEGGMSTGEPLLVRAAMKPIATLRRPLASVDMKTKKPLAAGYERSDVCAVPAAAVVAEAMVAIELARVFQEKFGGDSVKEMQANWKHYLQRLARS
jgi:chorismate synthase